MLRNYLRIAARSLARQKLYAVINILGLAIGLAVAILILLYVRFESSYDDFQGDGDRLYRVSLEERSANGSTTVERALISPAVGASVASTFSQIEAMARLTPVGPLLSRDGNHVVPSRAFWADPALFEIMTVEIVQGDPVSGLEEPFTIALSETIARRLFGDEDPIGQTVIVNDGDAFAVVAVYKDLPANSHLHFDAVGSMASIARWFTGRPLDEVWDSPNYATYVRLSEETRADALASRLSEHLKSVAGVNVPRNAVVRLQRVQDIHLHSTAMRELEPQGSLGLVRLFLSIAVFIILIAAINCTNLAVAASRRRDREVGVRKASGAARSQIVGQFLGESTVVTFFSLVLALVLVAVFLPTFNGYLQVDMSLMDLGLPGLVAALLAGCVVVGALAGFYPAFYLSHLKPSEIFRGRSKGTRRGSLLRSSLIVLQFSIAVALMLATLVVYRQLDYVRDQNLGFESENVIVLDGIREIAEDFDGFRQQLLRYPDVLDVSQSNPSPMGNVIPPSNGTAYHDDGTETATIYPAWIDDRYFETFDIGFLAGRDFDPERASDAETGLILNESAARAFGWQNVGDAVGKEVQYGGARRTVLGVTSDYHQETLHSPILPMGFYQDARNFRAISVKYRTSNMPALIDFLESRWAEYEGNRPLGYEFLDERVAAAYREDERLGFMIGAFAFLGIFVSCMGLFGVAAVTVERRRKEIGIRKTMGASAGRVVISFSMEFVRLSGMAVLIGCLVGYILMSRWLENFAYHTDVGWATLALVALVTVFATLAAVCYESVSAALVNPVDSLRHE